MITANGVTTPSIIQIPSALVSCVRSDTFTQGIVLGSILDNCVHVKQLLFVPFKDAPLLRQVYKEDSLKPVAWFVQTERPLKDKQVMPYFAESGLKTGLVRASGLTEYQGFVLRAGDVVEECEVLIPESPSISSFLQECLEIEAAAGFLPNVPTSFNLPTLPDLDITQYESLCKQYESLVSVYRLISLPDDLLMRHLEAIEANEERKKRLESCLKNTSPEDLIAALASVSNK